jgi:uncharacterized membrane protein
MANNERLTKRVRKMEEWIASNESGPTLDNMNYLITSLHNTTEYAQNVERQFNSMRNLQAEFLGGKDMGEEWNDWLKEKEKQNAVQKQQTEEVSVQEEAESSEEAVEAPKEKE